MGRGRNASGPARAAGATKGPRPGPKSPPKSAPEAVEADVAGLAARRVAHAVVADLLGKNRALALEDALAQASRVAGLDAGDAGLARAIATVTFRRLGFLRRALAARMEQGLPEDKPRLVALLATGAAQILDLAVPDHAAVDLAVRLAKADPQARHLAGLVASVVTLHQAPGALVVAMLAARVRDQRGWIVAVLAATLTGFLVLAFGPESLRFPASGLLGLGIGGCFGLGLSLLVLRTRDAASAGALSAMAQGIGYVFASLGPLGFGLAHDATDGWVLPAALFATIIAAAGVAAMIVANRA
ncbi:transcription antitermination factor NusB, partial [Methylobacterium sp. WL116]|uniref:transcription antitermination factor NusB n=1 Tax=Methylobacterium sp. WL116 TaxID=2603889 RepID=UPI0011DA848F